MIFRHVVETFFTPAPGTWGRSDAGTSIGAQLIAYFGPDVAGCSPTSRQAFGLSLYASFVIGTAAYPLTDIPLAEIVTDVARGRRQIEPAAVFGFHRIADAHT
jgi:hypothetical protein